MLIEDNFIKIRSELISRLRKMHVKKDSNFEKLAIKTFRFQAEHNPTYKAFVDLLKINPDSISDYRDIPFLPVEAFRDHNVTTGEFSPEIIYRSSGTTNSGRRSEHRVRTVDWYNEVSSRIYSSLVSPVNDLTLFALLPGYIERKNASLVEMSRSFMKASNQPERFYLNNTEALIDDLTHSISKGDEVTIIGVTHALLNLLESDNASNLPHAVLESQLTIVETGGMKGHGREPIRSEVHSRIRKVLPNSKIISEYGMTELLSQAYSLDGRYFIPPSWMRVVVRDPSDPGSILKTGRTGRIQIVDLANIDSCAFISTSDLGSMKSEDSYEFEVIGRFDHSEVRGCNLLSV
jgi:phenylacetate-coenzyme A ligase PaaK-like adenylate-forming protein